MTLDEALAKIDEQSTEIDELTKGNDALSKNNKKLTNEVRDFRSEDRKSDSSVEKLFQAEDKITALEADKVKLERDLKLSGKDVERFTGLNKELNGSLESLIIDGGLSDNLSKLGVMPQFMDATKALLRGQVSITDNKAVVGDKPLSEFLTEWGGADGKSFIVAPNNSGSGSGGGNNNSGGQDDTPKDTKQIFTDLGFN
jgi:hypothetical protein